MADLFNQQISATYSGLLKTSSSGVLSASLTQITDGRGNGSPLYISTTVGAVDGAINFYNAYTFPSADGLDGQVLKTDGAGVLTWENDSLSNTLNFSGGTGTGSVTLDSQVLAFTGTANQIETSASSQAITLSFPTAGVTLPNGSIATTQTASDNSTKVATTAYVEAAVAAGGDVTKTGAITQNQIAVWNDSTDELRSDETVTIGTDHSITLYQPNTNSITTNYIIGGGSSMTTGQQNTGFGSSVLTLNTTGVGNVAIGSDSLTTNVSGNNNVAIGLETLKRTTASDNIAIGSRVLQFDTTGYKNTAIGGLSQYNITTAYGNTSLGYNSLIYNSTGIQNTAIGLNSLKGVSTYSASNNTAIGYNSGSAITTGSYNVIIGSNTGSTIATSSSNIIISDGSGTIRQSFDFTGAATFNGAATFSGNVTASGGYYYGQSTNSFVRLDNTIGSQIGYNNYAYSLYDSNGVSFYTAVNATPTLKLNISSGGNVTITQPTNGNDAVLNLTAKSAGGNTRTTSLTYDADTEKLIINNAGTEILRMGSSTGVIESNYGIAFPNQSAGSGAVSSSTLDAYEEGTWDATLTATAGGGTFNLSPSYNSGTYTRIGNTVTVTSYLYLSLPNTGTPTGYAVIGGLPFTSASSTPSYTSCSVFAQSLDSGASGSLMAIVYTNSTTIGIYRYQNGVAGVSANYIKQYSELIISATYQI